MVAKNTVSNDVAYIKGKLDSLDDRFEAQDKRINGTMESFKSHIKEGTKWRIAILGIVVAILFEAFNLFSQAGQSRERMNNLTKCLTDTTEKLDRHIERDTLI